MLVLIILGSYILGSIPFGVIFSKLIKGKDVRAEGTQNIGTSNVLVTAGVVPAALTMLCDIGKGFLSVYLARKFIGTDLSMVLAGIASVVGHDFSVFIGFSGGKGAATTIGALLALDVWLTSIILLGWILVLVVTNYFILSTLILFVLLPVMMWIGLKRWEYIFFAVVLCVLAFYSHRKDIKRMFEGHEVLASEAIKKYFKC